MAGGLGRSRSSWSLSKCKSYSIHLPMVNIFSPLCPAGLRIRSLSTPWTTPWPLPIPSSTPTQVVGTWALSATDARMGHSSPPASPRRAPRTPSPITTLAPQKYTQISPPSPPPHLCPQPTSLLRYPLLRRLRAIFAIPPQTSSTSMAPAFPHPHPRLFTAAQARARFTAHAHVSSPSPPSSPPFPRSTQSATASSVHAAVPR